MNLAFLFALGVVLVYSFTEDGTIEGPYSMHTKPWDAFAANINVVAIFPLDMLGETRLNEDETKLTLHLALKRIHDEDLIDPKYLRLDETTIRLIPNYCDSEKILKKVLQIYNQPSVSWGILDHFFDSLTINLEHKMIYNLNLKFSLLNRCFSHIGAFNAEKSF